MKPFYQYGQTTLFQYNEQEVNIDMNLKELADSKTMGHVMDLGAIPTDVEVFERNEVTKEGRAYTLMWIELNGKKYKLTQGILTQIAKLPDDVKQVTVTAVPGTENSGKDIRYMVVSA